MFLSCGEALYDLFPSAETDAGFTFDARIGGSPFNVAVGLSRLGRGAALFTGLSSDPLGRRLKQTLKEEGVETAYLVGKQSPTTLALVGLDPRGTTASMATTQPTVRSVKRTCPICPGR